MQRVLSTLRTLGVLLAIWAGLALWAFAAGVVPPPDRAETLAIEGADGSAGEAPDGSEGGASADGAEAAEPSAASASTGATEGPTEAASAEPARPLGAPSEASPGGRAPTPAGSGGPATAAGTSVGSAEPAASPSREVPRYTVCPNGGLDPSIAAGQLGGDERPELASGCADRWVVIGLGAAGPERVAEIRTPEPPASQRSRLGAAAFGDLDGDERDDLALPLLFETDAGASRGGLLAWIGRAETGAIRTPATLATISAAEVRLGALDAAAGADLVVLNRTNVLAQLPSEVWVFRGGPSPTRSAALALGTDGRDLAVADVDRDGFEDVLAVSRDRLDLHFGDGEGRFKAQHRFELPGARESAVGDLDGDGATDFAVLDGGLRWFRAGPLDVMEPRGVDGVPAGLRGLQIIDATGDGKLDFTGWEHPRLVVLRHRGELSFEARDGLRIAGGPFGAMRHLVLDLDGDGATDDVVLLGRATGEAADPLELVLLVDATRETEVVTAPSPRPLPDAPLVLRTALGRR
ncbi:MAG: FG-GAP-like repeat-containing protein [Sandaracinaceae bacterium]